MTLQTAFHISEMQGSPMSGRFRAAAARLALETIPDRPWISSFAACPRHLSDGKWVWLRPFQWRWARAGMALPLAVQSPRLESRALPAS